MKFEFTIDDISKQIEMLSEEHVNVRNLIFGKLTIYFSILGKKSSFVSEYSNVFLFLEELDIFISNFDKSKFSILRHNFEPIGYANLDNGLIYLSYKNGVEFDKYVFDKMKFDELKNLKEKINIYRRKYNIQ